MAIFGTGKSTPKGTPPQPTRRATKHKTPAYGQLLMVKHMERKIRRAAAKAFAAAEVGKKTQAAASAAAKAARK